MRCDFPFLSAAQLISLLQSGDRELLAAWQKNDTLSSRPQWFQQALALLLPDPQPLLLPAADIVFTDEQLAAWQKMPAAPRLAALHKISPAERLVACTSLDPDTFSAKELIALLGARDAAERCSLRDIDAQDLAQLLAVPGFIFYEQGFATKEATAIEDILLGTPDKSHRYSGLECLDKMRAPDAASILKRLRLGQPCTQLSPAPEVLQSLLAAMEAQPLDLTTLRLAHFLQSNLPANDDGDILLPKPFLDRLETAAPQIAGEAAAFALVLLNQQRPQSPQIRPLLRRLILARGLELADPVFRSDWSLTARDYLPKDLQLAEDEATALRQILRLSPNADLADFAALLPQAYQKVANEEESLQLVSAVELLRQHRPLAQVRQEELRKEIGLPCYSPPKLWQRARLASSLRSDSESEAKEIFELFKWYPDLLNLLPKRPDWAQLRQAWEKSLCPDDLKQAQALTRLGCRLPQATWVDLLRRVQNEADLLLLLRLASNQPPLAPELEAALTEALEHSRNRDFFFLNHRQKESGPYSWPDPAAAPQEERLWLLKCRLAPKRYLSSFQPWTQPPGGYDAEALVSRLIEAPAAHFPELRAELLRITSKAVATRILVRALGETDDPSRLRALLKELPAELKSVCYWKERTYSHTATMDLRALSFWVATGIIPESEVPAWLRPHLSGLIFSETEKGNQAARLPVWRIENDHIVFSPVAPSSYATGNLSTLWPFLSDSLRRSCLDKIKNESQRGKLEKILLRMPPPELSSGADDEAEGKIPLTPPFSVYTKVDRRWGSLKNLDGADAQIWFLSIQGDFATAAKSAGTKSLQSCWGYLALVQESESRQRSAEERRQIATARQGLLKALIEAGGVDLKNPKDRQAIVKATGFTYIDKLLPHLSPEDLRFLDNEQFLVLLRHPQFPKAWLQEDAIIRLVLHQIESAKEDPALIDQYLSLGLPAAKLASLQSDGYVQLQLDALLKTLITRSLLPLGNPKVKKVVFSMLFRTHDEGAWAAAGAAGLSWSSAQEEHGSWIEPIPEGLKTFADWSLLQLHTGLDLQAPALFRQILLYPCPPAEQAAARLFLKQAGAKLNPFEDGSNWLCQADPDWFALLLAAGLKVDQLDAAGRTALFWRNDLASLKALLAAGADAKILDHERRSVLFGKNDPDIVKLLAAAGAPLNQRSKDGRTIWNQIDLQNPQWFSSGSEDIDGKIQDEPLLPWMETLLQLGTDPTLKDAKGQTPLHFFARAGRPLLLRRLLATGIKDLASLDAEGHNALDAVFLYPPGDARRQDPQASAPFWEFEENRNSLDQMRLVCAAILHQHGMKLTLSPQSAFLDAVLRDNWQALQAKPEADRKTALLPSFLLWDDPDFSLEHLGHDAAALSSCVDACAWKSAVALLKLHPEIIQPGSQTTLQIIDILKEKRRGTVVSYCVRRMGSHQDAFDAFEAAVKKLAEKPKN